MEPQARKLLPCPPDYNFEATVRFSGFGPADPSVIFQRSPGQSRLVRAAYYSDGPAVLELVPTPAGLNAAAWGPAARQAVAAAENLAGLNDNMPEPTHNYWHHHPVVSQAAVRFRGLRLMCTEALGYSLVPNILQQQIEWRLAADIWRKMIYAYGAEAPGPFGLRLPVDYQTLHKLPTEALVSCGLTRRRAALLREIGRLGPRMDNEWLPNLDPAELSRRLTAMGGMGQWTVDHTLGFYLGQADVVPLGDYALPHTVAYALTGQRRSNDKEMLQLLAPFAGHRFRVIRLLMAADLGRPRRGPRKDRGQPSRPRRPMGWSKNI